MNVNQLIIDTLSPIVADVVPDIYEGTSTTYITFNYADDRGELYADDEPEEDIAEMQIHLFTKGNYMTLKKQIRSALFGVGFSYPSVVPLYEDDTQLYHCIFECEIDGETEV